MHTLQQVRKTTLFLYLAEQPPREREEQGENGGERVLHSKWPLQSLTKNPLIALICSAVNSEFTKAVCYRETAPLCKTFNTIPDDRDAYLSCCRVIHIYCVVVCVQHRQPHSDNDDFGSNLGHVKYLASFFLCCRPLAAYIVYNTMVRFIRSSMAANHLKLLFQLLCQTHMLILCIGFKYLLKQAEANTCLENCSQNFSEMWIWKPMSQSFLSSNCIELTC